VRSLLDSLLMPLSMRVSMPAVKETVEEHAGGSHQEGAKEPG
jgi:hypothetical protein